MGIKQTYICDRCGTEHDNYTLQIDVKNPITLYGSQVLHLCDVCRDSFKVWWEERGGAWG